MPRIYQDIVSLCNNIQENDVVSLRNCFNFRPNLLEGISAMCSLNAHTNCFSLLSKHNEKYVLREKFIIIQLYWKWMYVRDTRACTLLLCLVLGIRNNLVWLFSGATCIVFGTVIQWLPGKMLGQIRWLEFSKGGRSVLVNCVCIMRYILEKKICSNFLCFRCSTDKCE